MRATIRILAALSIAVLPLSACSGSGAGSEGEHDLADDSFLSGGKADTGGIVEGSPEANGALKAASEASLAQLLADPLAEEPGAGLYPKAAEAIVAHREQKGGPFESLEELDAVPYVGPVAFWKLADFAERAGYVAASGKIYRGGEPLHYGGYVYLLAGDSLLKQKETVVGDETRVTVVWQRYVQADRLALDAAQEKLVAFGPHKLYVVTLSGVVEKTFDEGYADVPQSGGTATSSVCAFYSNMADYYGGKSLAAYMTGNIYMGGVYGYWAWVFRSMVQLYC